MKRSNNKYFFCNKEISNETLEELLATDPNIEEYNDSINNGQSHETAVFVCNLANTMYLTDAPCTLDQMGFLWVFFLDIAALLYTNSPLIKNNMHFILQDGLFKYKNNSLPMNKEQQDGLNYIYELLTE